MRTIDNRKIGKVITFRELQIGGVFEKSIDGRSDGGIWIKTDYKDSDAYGWDEFNAFRLSDDPVYAGTRCGYFNADMPVKKLDTEIIILGESK